MVNFGGFSLIDVWHWFSPCVFELTLIMTILGDGLLSLFPSLGMVIMTFIFWL